MMSAIRWAAALVIFLSLAPRASESNYLGIQIASLVAKWPGIHLDYERRFAGDYGVLLSVAGYRWAAEATLRSEPSGSISGFSVKAEPRRYLSDYYFALPLAYTAFDGNLSKGGFRYSSLGLGVGKKKSGRMGYLDVNIQTLFATEDPIRTLGNNGKDSVDGRSAGFGFFPERFPWFLNSAYPNMNIDINIILGFAW